MVGRKSTQWPSVATPVPDGNPPASRVTRYARWLRNAQLTDAVYCLPYAAIWLRHVALQTLVVVIAGRVVGRGGVALRRPVVSQGRALPLAWQVRQGKKGPLPEARHSALVEPGSALRPAGARGLVRGEGALDGTRLPDTVQASGGSCVVRTGRHLPVVWDGDRCRCETGAAWITPGTLGA